MRRLIFLSGLLAITMTACQEQLMEGSLAGQGEVEIALASESHIKPLMTRSEEESVPDAVDFMVEIYSSSGIRLYRDTYANSSGKRILLNSGDYRLLAQHGDSAGVGFNAAWFAADQSFTVHPQTHETVEAVAKMSKVKVAVNFGPQIALEHPDYYAEITSDRSELLKFTKDETRAGYMPAGIFTPLVYAVVDGELKYCKTEPVECFPNDFVTFHIDTKPIEHSLKVSVTIDNGVEIVEKDLTIPSDMMPKDEPVINVEGFDGGNALTATEACSLSGNKAVRANLVAKGKIGSCVLALEGASALGLPASVDLCDMDETVAGQLETLGIEWLRGMKGQRLGYVDFTGFAEGIVNSHCDPQALKGLSFSLTVTDELGREVSSEKFSIAENAPAFTFDPQPWNAYARRIDHLTADISVGNPDALEIQCFVNGGWASASSASIDGTNISYNAVTGLAPVTEYQVRAIYNGNDNLVIGPVTLTTEAAAQVANAGFEYWETLEHMLEFKLGIGSDKWHPINWDKPTDGWWAVNSKKTMPSSTWVTSSNWNWVRFPSVAYTNDCTSGSKAAMIYTVNAGDFVTDVLTNRGIRVAGELFIGSADDSGNHSSDGHAFTSRPDKLKFQYKYDAQEAEKFSVTVTFIADDNTTEMFSSVLEIGESLAWTEYEIPLDYADFRKKAGQIRVEFKASTASTPGVSGNYTITIRNGEQFTGNFGSILKIDDIELIYE